MDKDADDIDDIEEFKKRLDKDSINCIKINNNGQIFYRSAKIKKEKSEISEKKREQEIEKDSDEFSKLCLKLFKYSKRFVMPNSNTGSGLSTILIKEYAKRQNGGRATLINIREDTSNNSKTPLIKWCLFVILL